MVEARAVRDLPRIGLVANDALRVLGLQTILGDGESFRVVQLAGAAAPAPDLELIVIDATTTENPFGLIAAFRRARPNVALLVLGMEADLEAIERVIGAGARGYLSHGASEQEVRMAIDVVLDGSIWAPRKVLARLLRSSRGEADGANLNTIRFTRREHEVLRLLVLGQPNREIAGALGVDEGTVKAHMGRLMRKAGVDNRTALSMRALERQWIRAIE